MQISDEEVKEFITPAQCLNAVEEGFRLHATGHCVDIESHCSLNGIPATIRLYAAQVPGYGVGAKVLGAFEPNPSAGKPYIQAYVLILDGETGEMIALLDGRYLTALRTAAATALGARTLARRDSRSLGILGSGLQARTNLLCHLDAFPFEQAFVWGRSPEAVEFYLREMRLQVSVPLMTCETPEEVCEVSDVLVTTTLSQKPLFAAGVVRPGTHIGVVGPFRREGQEIPLSLVKSSLLFVDSNQKFAMLWDGVEPPKVEAELGSLLMIRNEVGRPEGATTIFKPVGMGFEDVVTASVVLRNIRARNRPD